MLRHPPLRYQLYNRFSIKWSLFWGVGSGVENGVEAEKGRGQRTGRGGVGRRNWWAVNTWGEKGERTREAREREKGKPNSPLIASHGCC